MKSLLLLALALPAFAGDLYQHIQLPLVDAYVDSAAEQGQIPGLTETRYSVSVSFATQDAFASAFGVYIRIRLEDGTDHVVRALLERNGSDEKATAARFSIGAVKPVKVLAFYVVRMHPESSDQLIH